jgi:hypothetical protein
MWTADNTVESQLWNADGPCAEGRVEAEFATISTQDILQFPLYDRLRHDQSAPPQHS